MVTLITENYQMIFVTFFGGGGGIFYLSVCLFVCLVLFVWFWYLVCFVCFFFVFFVYYFDRYFFFFENDKIRLLEELMTQNSCVIRLRV